ncbi:Heterokaryon incompatibility protein (HET) domain containing protein [Rhypophila sp. PSN 637]
MEIDFGPASDSTATTVLLHRVSDGLCTACRRLFDNISVNRLNIDSRSRNHDEIQRAARAGCAICKIVLASWDHLVSQISCTGCGPFYRLHQLDFQKYLLTAGLHELSDADPDKGELRIFLQPAPPGPSPFGDEAPPSNSGDDRCFQMANAWIRDCSKTHENCSRDREQNWQGAWLPSRLVDVSDLAKPRVILKTNIQDSVTIDVPYATLSHRWSEEVVRLTTANLDEFQHELPVSSLSKTFLDSFTVSRNLGIKYIWIDSLCILQDSEFDWQVESTQMGQVYENALVNLSATAASYGSHRDGLFQHRDPIWGSNLAFRLPHGKPDVLHRAAVTLSHRWNMNVVHSPLYTRGWVIQERFLSPRSIYFATDEIFWECRTHFASETCPMPQPISKAREDLTFGRSPELFKLHSENSLANGYSTSQILWRSLVKTYARSALTKETDRLVALSGVARAFSPTHTVTEPLENTNVYNILPPPPSRKAPMPADRRNSSYLAGLWEDELPWNLSWRATPLDEHPCTKAREYRAPSWSWASLDFQRVSLETSHDLGPKARQPAVVEVLGAVVEWQQGFDRFGPLTGGHLLLRGHVYDIDLHQLTSSTSPPSSEPSLRISNQEDLPFEFQLDDSTIQAGGLQAAADCCLPIFMDTQADRFRIQQFIQCLLLKKIKRQARLGVENLSHEYTRVGILRICLEDFNPYMYKGVKFEEKMVIPEILSGVVNLCKPVKKSKDGKKVAKLGEVLTLY